MSRIGKKPIFVPSDVSIQLFGNSVSVIGKLGSLSLALPSGYTVNYVQSEHLLHIDASTSSDRALWGTLRAHLNNMVIGVTNGFLAKLLIEGVGFRASVSGQLLQFRLGYSHDVYYQVPEGIRVVCVKSNFLYLFGMDINLLSQVSASIKRLKLPEPYKAKGIRFEDEVIYRKEIKKK